MKGSTLKDVLLGIDIGTGSIKLALMDDRGSILAIEKKSHAIDSPREGWAEIPMEDLWSSIREKIKDLLRNAPEAGKRVRGIGISCFCPGLTPISEEGRALASSILYMDSRSLDEVEEIRKKVGEEELFRVSGNTLMPGATSLTSMLWFRNHHPEVHKKTAVYGHINTFVGKRLTGKFGIDYSNASYTGLFQTGGGLRWSSKIATLVGIEEGKLPPLLPSWVQIGSLIDRDFIAAGLPAGIPVAMGGGDTACAAFSIGAIEHNQVFESAGTSNVLTVCSKYPKFDWRFMNRCHVVPGRWLLHGAMSTTGAALKWLRDEVFALEHDEEFKLISSLIDRTSPDEPCPIFLPYMAGERSPIWDPRARGVFFGLSLTTGRGQLVRALFEGCAFGLRQLLEIVETITKDHMDRIQSIGGGSMIDPWNQIKADVTGRVIEAQNISESAVIGAALLGGMASGVYEFFQEASASIPKRVRKTFVPDHSHDTSYQKRYNLYVTLYPRLRDLFTMQS